MKTEQFIWFERLKEYLDSPLFPLPTKLATFGVTTAIEQVHFYLWHLNYFYSTSVKYSLCLYNVLDTWNSKMTSYIVTLENKNKTVNVLNMWKFCFWGKCLCLGLLIRNLECEQSGHSFCVLVIELHVHKYSRLLVY